MSDLISSQVYGIGTTSSNWANRLATYMHDRAKVARSIEGGVGPNVHANAAALDALANQLVRLDVDEPLHLLGMETMLAKGLSSAAGYNSGTPYVPSASALRVFSAVGIKQSISLEQFVTVWAAAEIRDAQKAYSTAISDNREAILARERAEAELDRVEPLRKVEADARMAAEAKLSLVTAERDTLAGQVAYLQEFVASHANSDALPVPTVKVEPEDMATSVELEQTLDKRRVNISPGLYLSRRDGTPWYEAKIGNTFTWIAPATAMTKSSAAQARERLAEAEKQPEPVAVSTTTADPASTDEDELAMREAAAKANEG